MPRQNPICQRPLPSRPSRKRGLGTVFCILSLSGFAWACSSVPNFDEVPHTPASHALNPVYISGPLKSGTSLTTLRRNLSRGTGMVFGLRFLFESDAFLRRVANEMAQTEAREKNVPIEDAERLRQFLLGRVPDKSATQTCFVFENDATEKGELAAENYVLKLERLSGAESFPLTLVLDPKLPERLKKERLPLTIRGEACTPHVFPYAEGFRVTYLRQDEVEKARAENREVPKVRSFEWLPWTEGVSQDLYRPTW